ncbi:very short patch repair endonuclease [Rhizobium leguminosarum]|uniref:very short patch repair endonuclease n=1 Tax=Rhizobium leguminosarum TaxID=384 RepID=UPI001C97942B|nr:very short patch repair endonuclease [Rhizobium leguminosarum]MBY5797685.1 DNA mismatch endonuclease Vsr [Rhizobium leguminosarum]
MIDTRTPEQRRRIMQSVGQKNTGPEIAIRRALHRLGYRFRLHARTLPGRPDIVFPSRRKVILVHGCFWHGHDCSKGRLPKSRNEYWKPKIEANKARDERTVNELKVMGWESLVIWQCEVARLDVALATITRFLGPPKKRKPHDN